MSRSWQDCVHVKRTELANLLHQPLAELARRCHACWGDHGRLNELLNDSLKNIPHCSGLYCLDCNGIQVTDNITEQGRLPGHAGRDRSQRPYMKEAMPEWGFLLSDAYIGLDCRHPSLTALQVVGDGNGIAGYLGVDFQLRDLPETPETYEEPRVWRQIKGDPAIRGQLFQQCRVDSPMDRNLEAALSILEELLTQRDVFQCQIHFSSGQITLWTVSDPYRYRILDHEALGDPDICLAYPRRPYAEDAVIPAEDIGRILETLHELRNADENIYLRVSSLNLFNGVISLTFSCDGSHYMRYDEFLKKNISFWFGNNSA